MTAQRTRQCDLASVASRQIYGHVLGSPKASHDSVTKLTALMEISAWLRNKSRPSGETAKLYLFHTSEDSIEHAGVAAQVTTDFEYKCFRSGKPPRKLFTLCVMPFFFFGSGMGAGMLEVSGTPGAKAAAGARPTELRAWDKTSASTSACGS